MTQKSGFSLVELMISIVIVGVLSIVAMPAYKKYITKSKMAEAYSILGTMERNQITYYNENNEFFQIYYTMNPSLITDSMVIEANAQWATLGYPAPIGSKVWFSYNTIAGKTDASGTSYGLGNPAPSGQSFVSPPGHGVAGAIQGASSVFCNDADASAGSLGVTTSSLANYDWALMMAVANLDGDITDKCTAVSRLVESKVASGKKPGSPSGFLVVNMGK